MQKHLTIILLLLSVELRLSAQNLVPNPSFETFTTCPLAVNIDIPMECIPWTAGTSGTCDYFNSCGPWFPVGVPKNYFGYQYAYTGEAYCGFYAREFTPLGDYREYVQTPLISPLVAGVSFYVSFYVSVANHFCGTDLLGAYFSAGPPAYTLGLPLSYTPQVVSNTGFLSDTVNWMLVEGCFVADGGENYITIGNFRSNDDTPIDPVCMNNWVESYYYLDEVYVGEIAPTDLTFDLGGPVEACYSYEIDPGLTDVNYLWEDGSNHSTLVVTVSGIYSVTVSKNCEEGVDSIEVIFTNAPPIELNPDDSLICAGESISFILDPTIGNYEWSDGSTSSNYTITASGFYEVTLDDGCDVTTDDIFVTVLDPPPPFSLGGDTVICESAEIEFNFDPGLGDFLWQDNSNSNIYTITQSGEYALTISNVCGEESSALLVDEETPALVNIGPATDTLCTGEFLDISLDPFLGNYVWQDGSTLSSFHIVNPGIYSVTLTQVCGQSSDSVNVMTLEAPTFNLADTLSECPGDTLLLAFTGVAGNFEWQDGSVNDSLSVTSGGTYSLTVSNSCGSAYDSVLVLYDVILSTPDLGPDFSLCPGEEAILLAHVANVNYLWQDLSTADSLLITGPGTYHLTISNSCFTYSDTIVVTTNSNPPSVNLPDQLSLCEGSVDTLDAVITGVTYVWNDGTQNASLIISEPGYYSVTVSNACGMDMDSVQVMDGGPLPFVSLGIDTALCPGEMIIIYPSFSDVDSWIWPDGSSLSSYTVLDAGMIDVMVSNACGIAYDTLEITLLEATPIVDLGADTTLCPGESITFSISFSNVMIQWSDGSTVPEFLIDVPGTYYTSIANACGISTDTVVVDPLPEIPALDLGADLPLCPGELITIVPNIPNVNYFWQDGSTDTFYISDHSQSISLIISNACGSSSDTLDVYISTDGPDVELGPDVLVCEGEAVTIQSHLSGVDYLWQDGSTNASFTTNMSGKFYLQVSNTCGVDIDTIEVAYRPLPEDIDLGPDTMLCPGESLLLVAPSTGDSILWQDGSTGPSLLAEQEGQYALQVSNECGAKSDELLVTYNHQLVQFALADSLFICHGESVVLDATQSFNADYEWSTGSTVATISINTPGNYAITVTTACEEATDQVVLYPEPGCASTNEVYIPNIISPNGDHVNDVFSIYFNKDVNILSMKGSIFDRWGDLVFSSTENPFSWDGTFGEKDVNPAVFVYTIEVVYIVNAMEIKERFVGDVTVVR